jgi:hypothetical protein
VRRFAQHQRVLSEIPSFEACIVIAATVRFNFFDFGYSDFLLCKALIGEGCQLSAVVGGSIGVKEIERLIRKLEIEGNSRRAGR